jgi:hypothetical protein
MAKLETLQQVQLSRSHYTLIVVVAFHIVKDAELCVCIEAGTHIVEFVILAKVPAIRIAKVAYHKEIGEYLFILKVIGKAIIHRLLMNLHTVGITKVMVAAGARRQIHEQLYYAYGNDKGIEKEPSLKLQAP